MTQQYTVIVENDLTQWEDDTGSRYHFPRRYSRLLTPGTLLLHYKGRLRDKEFASRRMSPDPHYFAFSIAGSHSPDPKSEKGDLFVTIEKYTPFSQAVPHRLAGETLETIPDARKDNFWRDGVRQSSYDVFRAVAGIAGMDVIDAVEDIGSDDGLTTVGEEGGKKVVYGTRFERDPKLRNEAVRIHGTQCLACEMDLKSVYGEVANGFVHIHHRKPLSATGRTIVNPKTDLVPLCPNCHSIAHLGNSLRSVNVIRALLGKSAITLGD
ncbi:HNH endonuclease [Rhizobium sp. Root1203]|uniref:HNH endonuclease n=1 Tax=Rhizobium sp. Root1203 TaxID=1736427 RepID=UPI000B2BE89A|nr:HNH endonuclease [Rhizobium sp. Root1203]